MRDIIILIVVFIIGIGVGYIGQNVIKPYVEPYIFDTSLILTMQSNSTSVILGETVSFTATFSVTLPQELQTLEEYIMEPLLQNKKIELYVKPEGSDIFYTADVQQTTQSGTCILMCTFNSVGIYEVKAVFEGTNLLRPTESNVLTINVTEIG